MCRLPVLRHLARELPDARIEVHIRPAHGVDLDPTLTQQKTEPYGIRRGSGMRVESLPQVADFVLGEFPVAGAFLHAPYHPSGRMGAHLAAVQGHDEDPGR